MHVSEKHGINPAIPICFYCGEEKNEIILAGYIKGDMEAPKNSVWNMEPCDKCTEYMKMGIILMSVEDNADEQNPYRTGKLAVITEESVKRIFTDYEKILECRFAFIEDSVWEELKLPMFTDD